MLFSMPVTSHLKMCEDLAHATRCGWPLAMALLSEVLSALSIWGICPRSRSITRFGAIYNKRNRPPHLSVFTPVGMLSPCFLNQFSNLSFYRGFINSCSLRPGTIGYSTEFTYHKIHWPFAEGLFVNRYRLKMPGNLNKQRL